ncbi:DsbC family protein [Undibacterium oligocarboniphilum]|uniref:Thiol:disulfide interchange protein n=1 Tax=Undibacterium oligocarboniphilum TaxID=666702 RepID=A0A850QEQ9_9BURK|nr:DsbC family protein [Undibacterium oligocarboniphilum]MBC3871472.1 DsbC family protein [Undibacterium oligocarboniphilum]NVO78952.1 DsbC family protein [Undibacterium oligocarboniphilum]
MKKHHIQLALILLTASTLAAAGKPTESQQQNAVIQKLEQRLGAGQIETITAGPVSGLYEVRTKSDILYTDKEGKYLIAGKVIDLTSGKNLTEERLNEINKIDFKTLPLDAAIKFTKGDGSRVIAIFEDPNCGYCKKLRHTLQEMDNITIYTYQFNILATDSKTKSHDIWCAADRAKAWDEWMLNNKVPATASADCKDPDEKVQALGKRYRIQGTPAIIFTDGSRIPGYVDAKALETKLASVKAK